MAFTSPPLFIALHLYHQNTASAPYQFVTVLSLGLCSTVALVWLPSSTKSARDSIGLSQTRTSRRYHIHIASVSKLTLLIFTTRPLQQEEKLQRGPRVGAIGIRWFRGILVMNKSSELLSERFCKQRSGRRCDSSARYYPKPPESRPLTCSQSILLGWNSVKPLRNRYSPWWCLLNLLSLDRWPCDSKLSSPLRAKSERFDGRLWGRTTFIFTRSSTTVTDGLGPCRSD